MTIKGYSVPPVAQIEENQTVESSQNSPSQNASIRKMHWNTRLGRASSEGDSLKNSGIARGQNSVSYARTLAMCAAAGAVLGLSSPGFDQGYIAWFGLAPLFAFIFSAKTTKSAFLRSFVFGASYSLVYLHWFLSLDPAWAWFSPSFTMVTATFWWLFASFHQATIFGIFAIIARKIPLKINSVRREALPAVLVLPLLWVLIFNKIGNSSIFAGVPWCMLEYSQYKFVELLQIAKIIGGIGIGATIVAVNTAIFLTFATMMRRKNTGERRGDSPIARYSSNRECVLSSSFVTLLLAGIIAYGYSSASVPPSSSNQPINVSILQGNLPGSIHGSNSGEVVTRYVKMSEQAPKGLCLWTEWVLPVSLHENKPILGMLQALANLQKQDWLIGALEKQNDDTFNVVCGITNEGKSAEPSYRKRFLVPFGEILPKWLANSPVRGMIATCSPNRYNLSAGTDANVLKLKTTSAGALICLEVVSPELANDSVLNGAEILTDLSNTTWFSSPDVGQQLIAFAVMRAAETSRPVAFSTTMGPSAIVGPDGRILGQTKSHQQELLTRRVTPRTEITPFVRWFR
jgi:apolipoprotein N-acyltransferase